jgi:hypothetical protein
VGGSTHWQYSSTSASGHLFRQDGLSSRGFPGDMVSTVRSRLLQSFQRAIFLRPRSRRGAALPPLLPARRARSRLTFAPPTCSNAAATRLLELQPAFSLGRTLLAAVLTEALLAYVLQRAVHSTRPPAENTAEKQRVRQQMLARNWHDDAISPELDSFCQKSHFDCRLIWPLLKVHAE